MSVAVIALGSNLGDRAENLRSAAALLEDDGLSVVRRSSIWETEPVPADQPRFLNAAVVVETALAPGALLTALKAIEHELGRRPERRWGPRPIDLDILFYDDIRLETPTLTIPHPRVSERSFVLAPLSEVMRGQLPVLGQTGVELLAAIDTAGLQRTPERL